MNETIIDILLYNIIFYSKPYEKTEVDKKSWADDSLALAFKYC